MPTFRVLALDLSHWGALRVPFDKLYMFPREHEDLIPRMFPFSMVQFLSDQGFRWILRQVGARLTRKTCPVVQLHRERQGRKLQDRVTFKVEDVLQEAIANPGDYLVVVPMLFRYRPGIDDEGKSTPMYIMTNKKHLSQEARKNYDKNVKKWNTEDAARVYHIVHGKKVVPICTMCPNSMSLITGDCFYGSDTCSDHLSIEAKTAFQENIERFRNITETDECEPCQELTDKPKPRS